MVTCEMRRLVAVEDECMGLEEGDVSSKCFSRARARSTARVEVEEGSSDNNREVGSCCSDGLLCSVENWCRKRSVGCSDERGCRKL